MRGTSGRSPRHEGKCKGGFDEQRWWDDWWAMKELGGDDLDGRDCGQRLRQEQWDEIRSAKLNNEGMRMAERLGEEMEFELSKGAWKGRSHRLERGRRAKGQREGYGEWVSSAEESDRVEWVRAQVTKFGAYIVGMNGMTTGRVALQAVFQHGRPRAQGLHERTDKMDGAVTTRL